MDAATLEPAVARHFRALGHMIGNTDISFAAIGAALGHPVTIFVPDWMSAERRALPREEPARKDHFSHVLEIGGYRA